MDTKYLHNEVKPWGPGSHSVVNILPGQSGELGAEVQIGVSVGRAQLGHQKLQGLAQLERREAGNVMVCRGS